MRVLVCVLVAAMLSACASSGGPDNSVDAVCGEQSAMARNGTTAGGQITITCP